MNSHTTVDEYIKESKAATEPGYPHSAKTIAYANRAIKLDPTSITAHIWLYELHHKDAAYDEAIYHVSQILDQNLSDPALNATFYHNRGSAYTNLNKFIKAISDFEKAIELDPENTSIYESAKSALSGMKQITLYKHIKRYPIDEQIALLEPCISMKKSLPAEKQKTNLLKERLWEYEWLSTVSIGEIASYVAKIKLMTAAEKASADAANIQTPQTTKHYLDKADEYYYNRKISLAISCCNHAIRLDPNCATAYVSRANIFLREGVYEDAISDCSEAIRQDANYARAYLTRAKIYEIQEETDKAITDLRAILRLKPSDKSINLEEVRENLRSKQRSTPNSIWYHSTDDSAEDENDYPNKKEFK